MKFVITGSGRCGTHYMSTLLTAAGVPCSHEKVFSFVPELQPWGDDVADSSLMAIDRIHRRNYPVVLLVRNPMKVVKSWIELGMFGWQLEPSPVYNRGHDIFKPFAPWIYSYRTEQDKALAHWYALTTEALKYAEIVIRIDHFNQPQFKRLLTWAGEGGDPDVFYKIGPTHRLNEIRAQTNRTWDSSWDEHDPEMAQKAMTLAEQLGVL